MTWRIITADVQEGLAQLPDESVQTVITSPPYWGLRDYGDAGQLGLEPTPEQYVARLVEVFREVRRVLRSDGTVWLNLGDSYSGGGGYAPDAPVNVARREQGSGVDGKFRYSPRVHDRQAVKPAIRTGLKPKDLVGIPWRVAFALQADGWYLRSDIIWAKPNPMPESVTDRPTKSHEYVFLLAKSARYYFDADAVRETASEKTWYYTDSLMVASKRAGANPINGGGPERSTLGSDKHEAGRNIRSVWNIATEPFPEAHFATFPKKLVEPCVKAGTSEKGCCSECGAPFVRMTERTPMIVEPSERRPQGDLYRTQTAGTMTQAPDTRTLGWVPGCTHHESGIEPCTVLDPFAGSGTTGVVAARLGRSFVGIELNPVYAEMARERIRNDGPLFNVAAES